MPNKYQREIEEILRNMERTDHGQSLGERIRAFNRPSPRLRLAGPRMRLRLSAPEGLLVAGVVLALIGAGLSFYFYGSTTVLYANIAGAFGMVALACFVVGLVIGWRERFGNQSASMWRGQRVERSRPRRFRPFAPIVTQFRIMRLKWRYLRSRGR
jgi:hypothetical protein